jgi:hypothetical protein
MSDKPVTVNQLRELAVNKKATEDKCYIRENICQIKSGIYDAAQADELVFYVCVSRKFASKIVDGIRTTFPDIRIAFHKAKDNVKNEVELEFDWSD